MKKTLIILAALGAFTALPASAHHLSPAEPDIGDLMDMHETTVDSLIDSGVIRSSME